MGLHTQLSVMSYIKSPRVEFYNTPSIIRFVIRFLSDYLYLTKLHLDQFLLTEEHKGVPYLVRRDISTLYEDMIFREILQIMWCVDLSS